MDNSIYKKCTECGQTKHISEFSKSYPNRCKTCVAEHTRQMRAAEKLKAKVKATGEVIDVEPSGTMQVLCGSFITKDGRRMPGTALEFEKAIDWEQRRYEIAKEIMKGFSANSHNQCVDASSETLAQWSISGADALIAELKKGGRMKVIVSFSGGKDSLASLLWVRNNLTKDFITVFCDTGWEHPLTYKYIEEVQEQLGLNLITVKSKKFNGMVDLTKKKSRWPSSQRRFCTSELKTIPMIDYILDEVNDDVLIIQGIRAAESAKRAEMSKQCTYFKYYVQPYGKDKNGKDKYHTYRRKDVLAFRKKYADDLLRPVFDWSAQQVIDYILENGIQPNPLYRMGYKRVGCFPCVMASQQDIYNISVQEPERISYIAGLEQQFNSSFFGPDKISSKYYKGEYPLISDVVRYVQSKRAGGSLFDDDVATSCMSYYGLCE